MFISIWNDASKRARAIREKKDSNERGRIDRTAIIICLTLILFNFFLCFSTFFDWDQRVWITKSDSHLERTVLLHGNLEDLTSFTFLIDGFFGKQCHSCI